MRIHIVRHDDSIVDGSKPPRHDDAYATRMVQSRYLFRQSTADSQSFEFCTEARSIDVFCIVLKRHGRCGFGVFDFVATVGDVLFECVECCFDQIFFFGDFYLCILWCINFISTAVNLDANSIKNLAFELGGEINNLFFIAGSNIDGKAVLTIYISKNITSDKLHAGNIVRELGKLIQGGGGGQPFFATAGGKNPVGISTALEKAKEYL